jgi:hypothetical protein
MSAFVLSKTHIDVLITAGLRFASGGRGPLTWYWPAIDADSDRGSWTSAELQEQANKRRRLLTTQTAGRVGALLLAENRRSIDHRYDETEWEEPYLFEPAPGWQDPVIVLKAIACYEYQSCEHPGWETSEAHAFCQALRARTISLLPGYDEAPWDITDRQVFLPRPQAN